MTLMEEDKELRKFLGERVRLLLAAKGCTQSDMAKKCGVPVEYFHRCLQGSCVLTAPLLMRIAWHANVPLHFFEPGTEEFTTLGVELSTITPENLGGRYITLLEELRATLQVLAELAILGAKRTLCKTPPAIREH